MSRAASAWGPERTPPLSSARCDGERGGSRAFPARPCSAVLVAAAENEAEQLVQGLAPKRSS